MKTSEKLNMTMLCDFYELTMSNGYFKNGYKDRTVIFDVFFRRVPDQGGFAIAAGLEQLIEYIEDLHFSDDDIEYLRGRNLFCEEFLEYLKNFRFTGDIYAVPEGTPVFPKEPLVVVKAPAIEAQIIETFTLLTINHQSLIATKANRVVRSAQGRTVLEFGSRRAQGADAAIVGARAAYIGGVNGTACAISDQLYGVPAGGTMAHAWVQMFDTEYEAFKTYCSQKFFAATLISRYWVRCCCNRTTYNDVVRANLTSLCRGHNTYLVILRAVCKTDTRSDCEELLTAVLLHERSL